jgi:hypothetical protein
MWGRKPKDAVAADSQSPSPLKEAMHQARVEAAERTSVIVDLRDAELARLELLNEALNPLFVEVPPEVDLFDAASAAARRHGCGSTRLPMSRWAATSVFIVFCMTAEWGAACWRNPTKSRMSCRRLQPMLRAGWSSDSGRLRLIPICWRAFQTRWRGTTAGGGAGERWQSWRLDFSPEWQRCSYWQPYCHLADRSGSQ